MWTKDDIVMEMRRRNLRITKQRLVLLDVICRGNYSSGKEIYYEAIKKDSHIGLATVYRMLETLEEMGVLSRSYRMEFSGSPQKELE